MAYVIQDTAGANIFRIIPETPYPTDHDTLVDQARDEQDEDARPAIRDEIPADEFAQYDTVFVGYPNWWGDMPMIMYLFRDLRFFGQNNYSVQYSRRQRILKHEKYYPCA